MIAGLPLGFAQPLILLGLMSLPMRLALAADETVCAGAAWVGAACWDPDPSLSLSGLDVLAAGAAGAPDAGLL